MTSTLRVGGGSGKNHTFSDGGGGGGGRTRCERPILHFLSEHLFYFILYFQSYESLFYHRRVHGIKQ